jgi:hypothetical protein
MKKTIIFIATLIMVIMANTSVATTIKNLDASATSVKKCNEVEISYFDSEHEEQTIRKESIIVDSPKAFGIFFGGQEFTSPPLILDKSTGVRVAKTSDAIYGNENIKGIGEVYAIKTKEKLVTFQECSVRKDP